MPQQLSNPELVLNVLALVPASADEFVAQWSQWYSYPSEDGYSSNIGLPLTPARIHALFEWKNGGKLSARKLKSVELHYAARSTELNNLPANTTAQDFLGKFGGGAIWRIFLLHCWRPQRFPIYDQHVHRAMEFIQTRTAREISSSTKAVLRDYTERYVPFWRRFSATPDREVDKALWVFGKVLKQFPSGIRSGGERSIQA